MTGPYEYHCRNVYEVKRGETIVQIENHEGNAAQICSMLNDAWNLGRDSVDAAKPSSDAVSALNKTMDALINCATPENTRNLLLAAYDALGIQYIPF